jgi:hypothetical protein
VQQADAEGSLKHLTSTHNRPVNLLSTTVLLI